MERAALNILELTFAPVSAYGLYLMKNDKWFLDRIGKSKIYFIGQRPMLFFDNPEYNNEKNELSFSIRMNGVSQERIILNLDQFKELKEIEIIEFHFHECQISFHDPNTKELLYWFTPDRLIHLHSNENIKLNNFVIKDEYIIFDLLYIGISKKRRAYDRLIEGHHKLQHILASYYPLEKCHRISEEISIFFFDVGQTKITVSDYTEIDEMIETSNELYKKEQTIADAEKAFVKTLKPPENDEKYDNYPESTDGLFCDDVDRVSYLINEQIIFKTKFNKIVSKRSFKKSGMDNDSDFIFVKRDGVKKFNAEKLLEEKID